MEGPAPTERRRYTAEQIQAVIDQARRLVYLSSLQRRKRIWGKAIH